MTTDDNKYLAKTSNSFHCEKCNYTTSRKYNFNLHNDSIKHKSTIITTKDNKPLVKVSKQYECSICNKNFNDRAGLWRHNKKCVETNSNVQQNVKDDKDELIMMLIKDNSELKNMIMEVIKNGTHNTTNTSNTNSHNNSHNKAFNLNFFLNETCKDAMNIMDFVDSIKLQLSDLERVGEFGFVDGISNIIVQNLKALDVTERPIHCTDKKREVLYVKDENKWEKDEDKNKIKKAIKRVANKNMRLLPAFKQKYPDCNKSASIHSDQYNKMIVESMDTDGENENKIITNISKQVLVEKESTVATI
jgi:hypothetical protein